MPAKVLVVDDSPDARALYGEYLEFCGFRVETAADGEEAIAKARAQWPSVILMDLAMPRMDGWEAVKQLKQDPQTKGIPLIMLTAHAFQEHRDRAAQVGADAFLAKPVLPDQLAAEIRRVLGL